MEDEKENGKPDGPGGDGLEADVLGEEAGDAGQGGGNDHGGADLHADGVRGESFAEAFGGAGHEAGENCGETEAAEDEGNAGDGFGEVEQKENCTQD